MNKYGFPYKGSKNKLAEKIVKLFPDADNFYDLFCGGCAITHRTLIENRWNNYVINDIDSRCPTLLLYHLPKTGGRFIFCKRSKYLFRNA